MILWYLMYSKVLNRLVLLIIDAKVGITAYDQDMLKTLCEQRIDHIIVANKVDNLEMSQKEKQLTFIRTGYKNSEVVPYSAKQKHGRKELMKKIASYLS